MKSSITRIARRLGRDERGATALMVAVLFLVVFGVTAFVVDISKIVSVRSRAQQALDAAGLAATTSATDLDVRQEANNFFQSNFSRGYLGATFSQVNVTVSEDGSTYDYTVTGFVPFSLAQVFGNRAGQAIQVSTRINRDNTPFEVALVVDNGKSMAQPLIGGQTRSQVMRQGLTGLINTIYGGRESVAGAAVSIVNFSDAARIDANVSNGWLNLPYPASNLHDGCITNRKNANDATDNPPGGSAESRYWRYGASLFSANEVANPQYYVGGATSNVFDLMRLNFTGLRTLTPHLLVSYRLPHLWIALQNTGYRIFTQDPSLSYIPSYSPPSPGIYGGGSIPFGLPQTTYPSPTGRFDPQLDAVTRDINGTQLYSLNSAGLIDAWQPEQFQIDLGGPFPTTVNNFQMYGFFDRTQCDGPLSAEGEWNAFNFEDGFGVLTNKPHFQIAKTFARVVPVDLAYANVFRQINIEPVPTGAVCHNILAGGPWPVYSQTACPGGMGTCTIQDGSSFGITSFDYFPTCTVPQAQFFQNSKTYLQNYFANNFVTNGFSRSNIGMIWAWNALSPNWRNIIVPGNTGFPRDYGENRQKIAILLSAGNNFPGQTADDNNRLVQTCNAMKARNITIMTVSLNPQDGDLQNVLAQCASGQEFAFSVNSLDAMNRAFSLISQRVLRVRIVR